MARPVTVSTGAVHERTAAEIHELAVEAARKVAEKTENDQRPRAHGLARREHIFWTGYLNGLCSALAVLTGESSTDLMRRYQTGTTL